MTDDWAKHDPPPEGDERPPEKVKPKHVCVKCGKETMVSLCGLCPDCWEKGADE